MDDAQVARIIEEWTSDLDAWHGDTSWMGETFEDALVYPPSSLLLLPDKPVAPVSPYRPPPQKPEFRELPEQYAADARTYIKVICSRYPLQLRVLLGLAMWLRFCEVWNATGRRNTAMRVI